MQNEDGKLWLNVASSDSVIPGFVNVDNSIFLRFLPVYPLIRPILPERYRTMFGRYKEAASKAQYLRSDCRKPVSLPDGSVDHILCSHFLEHVKAVEGRQILADFFRVLKSGGTVHIVVPNLATAAERYVSQLGDPDAADNFQRDLILHFETEDSLRLRLLQFRGGFGLTHQWMYDQASLRQRLTDAGFCLIEMGDIPSAAFRKDDGSLHLVGVKS